MQAGEDTAGGCNDRRQAGRAPMNFIHRSMDEFFVELTKFNQRIEGKRNETENNSTEEMELKFLKEYEMMKLNHAMDLIEFITTKAKLAASKEVTDLLGLCRELFFMTDKTEIIWSIKHDAKSRQDFLFEVGDNDLHALKFFYREVEIQQIVKSQLFDIFQAKEEPAAQSEKVEGEGNAEEMQDS